MKTLVFVTQNPNKVQDAEKLLPEFSIEHVDFEVPELQSLDSKAIVEHKLQYAYDKVQKPCFVMDASLSLDCLNGFPGPFIKWWFEKTVGEEKTCKIANFFNEHGCQWTTVLGYFDGTDKHFLQETIKGSIAKAPTGENGYHWDTIFIPEGETHTFAEMTFEQKQSYAVTKKLLQRLSEIACN
ncbi:MAG: non-canonical purine NTP pyrophosphatase [Candidatus Yanofskybacteria bacterium]|nr:non-canonical purine NTP pyrophosphatase [Candidatus Yanofskybacteria bacterium]